MLPEVYLQLKCHNHNPNKTRREAQIKNPGVLQGEKQQHDYVSRQQVTDLNRQVINVLSDCLCLLV